MKVKSLLAGMMACVALGACTNQDLVEGENSDNQANTNEAYITVKMLTSGTSSRGTDGGFVNGIEDESKVSNARFYFFDENGNAYNVNANGNYVDRSDLDPEKDKETNSIESTIAVNIPTATNYPSYMVVVLNRPTSVRLNSSNLSELRESVLTLFSSDSGFIMTNSSHLDSDNNVVDAAPLTTNNFSTDLNQPGEEVSVYVERVAARVSVNETSRFDTETDIEIEGAKRKVYAVVNGFAIFDNVKDSYAVKQIDKDWTNADLGFQWNDFTNHRSSWAVNNSYDLDATLAYTEAADLSAKYCFENAPEDNTSSENATKVLVAATLGDENGNPVEIVKWMGASFVGGEDKLKEQVAKALSFFYVYEGNEETPDGTETEYSQFPKDDITMEEPSGNNTLKSYQVKPVLRDPNKVYYTKVNGKYQVATDDLKAQINSFLPAQIYTEGKTYYFTAIEHLGTYIYGVIRNHTYEIEISSIKGWGTPVYNPDSDTKFDPTRPDDDTNTYISAKINVLAWKIVKQSVALQ